MRVTVKHLHEHVDSLALADGPGLIRTSLRKRLKQNSSRLSQVPETTVTGRPRALAGS
jgi:hypothetical protein